MVGVSLHLGLVANMAGRELWLSRGAGEERGISRALPMGSLRKREMEWGGLGRERPRVSCLRPGHGCTATGCTTSTVTITSVHWPGWRC
jgi:hypothetical protein